MSTYLDVTDFYMETQSFQEAGKIHPHVKIKRNDRNDAIAPRTFLIVPVEKRKQYRACNQGSTKGN